MKQTHEFEDATIVAFLACQGHQITPLRNSNGRVVFEVDGDISKDIEAFYANQLVGVADYVRTFKALRSSIFTLKAMGTRKDNDKAGERKNGKDEKEF